MALAKGFDLGCSAALSARGPRVYVDSRKARADNGVELELGLAQDACPERIRVGDNPGNVIMCTVVLRWVRTPVLIGCVLWY